MTRIRNIIGAGLAAVASLVLFSGSASAHDLNGAGQPVCLEGNFMVADATGPGRVYEMNILTGEIGITVPNPMKAVVIGQDAEGNDILRNAWKPTGVLSGGVNGHAFISSAGRHRISEFHRDGTHIRTIIPITAPDNGGPLTGEWPFGAMPRLLGSQFMPNGNTIQAVCDAEFPPAFPRPASTPERAANSRLLVFDQGTLSEVDEYNKPADDRWTCMAGIIFSEEGMYVSMFHGAAVFVIDWKAGVDKNSAGFGANNTNFKLQLNKGNNRAEVIRVIDMYPGAAMDDPRRRDSLRAITLDADGSLYATNRARATAADAAAGPLEVGDPLHHVAVVPYGIEEEGVEVGPAGTIAMDWGVQVIAGIRANRISRQGCDAVQAMFGEGDPLYACDYETLYVAASGTKNVMEYLIGEEFWDGDACRTTGEDCAQPIATFFGYANGQPDIDPRMLMTIHEAFVQ